MSGKIQTVSRHAAPLRRRHMPADYAISLANYTKRGTPEETRIPEDFGQRQSLRGFEATYRNIIDYIVRITYRIWEDRDVEYIRRTYADASRTFDDYGLQFGDEKIVQDTYHTTGAFSDIELIADEVAWAGDDEAGFHSSHRTLMRGTNDGDSRYGPATGKAVDVLVIANCVSLENEIFLEHVLYNNSAMLLQLGFDLEEAVAGLVASPPAGWPRDGETWRQLRRAASPARPISEGEPIAGFDPDRFVRAHFDELWNRRNAEALAAHCSPSLDFRGPTNRAFSGLAPYRNFAADPPRRPVPAGQRLRLQPATGGRHVHSGGPAEALRQRRRCALRDLRDRWRRCAPRPPHLAFTPVNRRLKPVEDGTMNTAHEALP